MAAMGRRRTTHHGLPPHMARKGRFYYYVTNDSPRRWIPLGEHYGLALVEWAKLEGTDVPEIARTLTQVAMLYRVEVIPRKARSTQRDNERELGNLEKVFGDSPLETIRPVDVKRYLTERVDRNGRPAPIRANREIALLSHVINFARERGLVEMHNPCVGVRKNKEVGRERYLEDAEFDAIYAKGDDELRDAMDLLLLTSQRPGDVIKMKRHDIRDGHLWVRQDKTKMRLRIAIEGELAAAIDRMTKRPREATGVHLVQDRNGQPLTYWMLERRFARAREAAALEMPSAGDIQLRDIRGKAATDVEDLDHAQRLLGHASRTMTEHYVKRRPNDAVRPLTRKRR